MAIDALNAVSADDLMRMMNEAMDQAYLGYIPARRHGKSLATQLMTEKLRGSEITSYWVDEATTLLPSEPEPVAKFEDPSVPMATITVFEVSPNQFQVRLDKRDLGKPFAALPIAKAKAEDLHRRLVDAVNATRVERNPLYGSF